MEGLEKVMEDTNGDMAKIVTKAEVKRLLTDEAGAVVGVEFQKDGALHKALGPVIIATGGFGADYKNDSLLTKFRPELQALPTTNGEHCTGDGIKMAMAIGAGTIDMTSVQVHPTGIVHPGEPDAKVKFLAAEALRGVGGLLLNADGERFCDELGRRDYVSGEMNKNKGPFRLVLNAKASKEIEWHCKHYCGRGIMKRFASGAEVAKEIGVNPSVLAKTFADYNRVAQSKQCPYGKKFFHNLPMDMNDGVWHVAIVMPVVHYTMGGLQINTESQVTNESGHPIKGLYAAGEVAGGIHGRNRLGGNSLLDCVVFGRVAGDTASRDLLQTAIKALRTGQRPGQDVALGRVANLNAHINPAGQSLEQHASVGVGGGGVSAPPPQSFNAGGGGGGVSAGALTEAEVAKHNTEGDCWVILSGKVYDVSKFLPDHPGGKKAIMLFAGKDATEEFDMLHPPNVLKKYLPAEACLGPLA